MIPNPNNQKMLRRALLFTCLLLIVGFNLKAQILKKTLMVGGEIDIPLSSKDGDEYQFKIAPTFGYFVANNFVIGAEVETQINTWLGARRYNLGAGPLIRYYVGKNKLQAFGHISYIGIISVFNTSSSKYYSSRLKTGIGGHYLIIPSVAIETLISYDYFHTNDDFAEGVPQPHFAMHIGFQIYLPKN